jgi:hypothetical protein
MKRLPVHRHKRITGMEHPLLMPSKVRHRIAYFISPHGFGHAARAAAVMASLREIDPAIAIEIFTTVPEWFFMDSIGAHFEYHSKITDVGLVQKNPLHADLAKTIDQLNCFLPFNSSHIGRMADEIKGFSCELVVCDISPMGIAVAKEAGLPSVLVENFTWDWVYQEYLDFDSRLISHISYLRSLFDAADYHVQTEPVCRPSSKADLTTLPVSRRARSCPEDVRKRLGVPPNSKLVMVTMGGIPLDYDSMGELTVSQDIHFVIPGGRNSKEISDNLIFLPHHSGFFHPDLINASDAVVGKVGYSTLAEVYHGGVPFGYIKRSHFQESEILAGYIRNHMNGILIEEEAFQEGTWVRRLSDLLAYARICRRGPNGAEQTARFLHTLLSS